MIILQSSTFAKQVKKLHENQKRSLDQALQKIIANPLIGDAKKGNLAGVRVYKFSMVNELMLLACEFNDDKMQLLMLALGTHENFYRDLG
jgi:mRNA-degrading endonuclease YafQ of YafQ-DinJ toxin-antitoxin module